jgi:hypothetical protein
MALALALFALAVIGGMVAMSFCSALVEQQGGRNLILATAASEAAEGAVRGAMAELPADQLTGIMVGGPALALATLAPRPGLKVERQVLRLADNLYLLQCRADWEDGSGAESVARSVGLLARLATDSTSGGPSLYPIERRAWLQLY